MLKKKVLIILGTRPEAIKLAPIILELKKSPLFNLVICSTTQHSHLLDNVFSLFSIKPNYHLNLMQPNQSLLKLTTTGLEKITPILKETAPELVIVQGDTTTSFIGALASYYLHIPIAHIEAGLRTYNNQNPFPEEVNRRFISSIAHYHFTPTKQAKKNLLSEGYTQNIWTVGNTGIDALLSALKIIKKNESHYKKKFNALQLNTSHKKLLVTTHRRENLGKNLETICKSLKKIAQKKITIIIPAHPNPLVVKTIQSFLKNIPNIHIIPPQPYDHFIYLMTQSDLILTDSGGIQEEAPSLGIKTLVLRNHTERTESLKTNQSELIDITQKSIIEKTLAHLNLPKLPSTTNPYGNGKAAKKIVKKLACIG